MCIRDRGSDIAIDAADIALVNDEIRELPHLLRLSRRMLGTIKLNLTFSMALNFAAIALAITGVLNPVVGALVHNAGSVLVIINLSLIHICSAGTRRIMPCGQALTHSPQPMHFDLSTSATPFAPTLMAPSLHAAAQLPSPRQPQRHSKIPPG